MHHNWKLFHQETYRWSPVRRKDIPKGKIEFNKVLELDPTNKPATDGLNQIRKYETAQQNKGKAKPSGTKP